MTAAPILIRFRNPADLAEQVARHEANALADAIHDSSNLRPLSAQQPAPHATPRVNCAGSALAARLEELEDRYLLWRRLARQAEQDQAWDDHARYSQLRDGVEQQYVERARQLGTIDAARSVPGGLSGVYVVTIPPYTVQEAGSEHTMTVTPTRRIVDTREASAEAQAWLRAYRHGGSVAMPWEYRRRDARYHKAGRVPQECRERLKEMMNDTH